jgi:hydrogenase maturation protein HypF
MSSKVRLETPVASEAFPTSAPVRRRFRIAGIVQGVGFRPFIHSLAVRFGLAGFVGNDTRGVIGEIEGSRENISAFFACLVAEAPPLAIIERVAQEAMPAQGECGFTIVESRQDGVRQTLIAPDVATCAECLRELFDPTNRRYHYPFINCTHCGPRFTIVCDIPYDRPFTTMAGFPMCADCAREYHDPADRRFHAQPIACPACGPRLRLVDRCGQEMAGEPLHTTAALLWSGAIIAVKGLGGYHLAAGAANETAVSALRARKHREDKPFVVMVPDLTAARTLADITHGEEQVLSSVRRPIVLVRRRADAPLADAVAPGNRCIGVMLPYTPLHHLLCHHLGAPFVLTSGNVSDEPIAYRDKDAFRRLAGIADYFLTHDRPIHTRTDDSVVRVVRGREVPIRRSRGYAPQPLLLPRSAPRPILACGAELKNTFCLVKGSYAFLSHHIGDLENYETWCAFEEGVRHFSRLFDVRPQVVAYDLHPEYLSTKYALALTGVELVGVQHHHAHIAACLADNGESGPAIGVSFDGLGYGLDGTIWGGEFLVADLGGFQRAGHFEAVPMPGGTAAIKQPWRMAAAYLQAAYGEALPQDLAVRVRNQRQWQAIMGLLRTRVNSPSTSSVGRLFDAVAAIIGVRDVIHYEGQAAVELEQWADETEQGNYGIAVDGSCPYRVRGSALVRAVVEDLRSGTAPATVTARFHNTLVRGIVEVCTAIRTDTGLSVVALSGGVFQNLLLLERTMNGLAACGFRILTHARVPTNDGGISFGQAVIAAARDVGFQGANVSLRL